MHTADGDGLLSMDFNKDVKHLCRDSEGEMGSIFLIVDIGD